MKEITEVTEIIEIAALLVTGALVGIEFGVTAFFHPILERLPDPQYVQARGASARVLGKVMPFWYGTALALQLAVAVVWPGPAVIGAVVTMVVVMALTLTALVPVNNRVAAWAGPADISRADARRWDRLHWVRVGLLAVGFVLLLLATPS
ncbi:DUF1772 domain-containing protein [Mycobacterium sp. NPDC003449]